MREFQQVRMFLKLAEVGSVSAAARALGVPHSTVSRQLAQLEADIGSRLAQRSTRSFRLTPAGQVVRREFLKIADARGAIEDELHGGQPSGVLRVSVSHAFALAMVAPTLPAFARRHPNVRLSLSVTNRRVDVITDSFDVVIRNGNMQSTGLAGRRLGATPFIFCASPNYLSAAAKITVPADLAKHPALAFHPEEDAPQHWTPRQGAERAEVPIAPVLNANDVQLLLNAAESRMGVACLPARLCRDSLRAGRLVRVLPDWDQGVAETYALFPSRRALSPRARAFVDHLVASLDFATF